MLIKVSEVSEGDTIITIGKPNGATVQQIEVNEDGSVKLQYTSNDTEWYTSNQIVVRRDKKQTFFNGPVYSNV